MLARAEGRGAEVERRDDLSPAARSRGQEQDHREHADRAGQVQADPEAHDPAADPEPDHPSPRPGRQDAQPGQGRKHDVLSDQGHLRVQVRRPGFDVERFRNFRTVFPDQEVRHFGRADQVLVEREPGEGHGHQEDREDRRVSDERPESP